MHNYKLTKKSYRAKPTKLNLKELKLKYANHINDYKECVEKLRHKWVKLGMIPQILIDDEKKKLIKLKKLVRETRNKIEYIMKGFNLDDLFKINVKNSVYTYANNTLSKV